jgi:hypothetical protein
LFAWHANISEGLKEALATTQGEANAKATALPATVGGSKAGRILVYACRPLIDYRRICAQGFPLLQQHIITQNIF